MTARTLYMSEIPNEPPSTEDRGVRLNMEKRYIWLPKAIDARPGLVYEDSPDEWKRYPYTLSERIMAIQPQNQDAHASNDGKRSLCGLGPWTNAVRLVQGPPEEVAPQVGCRYCQARLVQAGVLDPEDAHPYARYYGRGEGGGGA